MKRSHALATVGAIVIAMYLWQPERPAPVYVQTQPPAPVVYAATPEPEPAPAPVVYTLTARVLKTAPLPYGHGTACDVEVTNTGPEDMKELFLQMTYTGHAGEYLGTCDVRVTNLRAGQTGIGVAKMRDVQPEALAAYTLRVDTVLDARGAFSELTYTVQ